jgi:hypothetical protein
MTEMGEVDDRSEERENLGLEETTRKQGHDTDQLTY